MNNFNNNLIQTIKLFHTEESEINIDEEKYYFIKYLFSNLESLDANCLELCEEEFDELHSNIDAFYFDEDNATYNLYLAIYNDQNDDNSILNEVEINNNYNKIINFLKNAFSGQILCYGESSFTYEIAETIYKNFNENEIIVNIFTNYNIPSDLQKDGIEEINGKRVSFMTYDLEDLENKFKQINNVNNELRCQEKFDEDLLAIKISSTPDIDVYMSSMKGIWLSSLYKEDSIRLLESNVRSYLKRTAKVNAGIMNTVKNDPDEFVSFNNGISAVATSIIIDKENSTHNIVRIKGINNFQIVNGGQTTATLFECQKDKYDEQLSQVIVPLKLTVVKNIANADELIRSISLYSNTQTVIKKSDPPSNLPFYIKLKNISKKCVSTNLDNTSYICYFERTNGEYNTELRRNNSSKSFRITNPKDKSFTKIELATAINSWEQLPYIVSLGREKNFTNFNNNVKLLLKDPDEKSFMNAYALIVIYRKLDKIAKKLKLSYKNNVVSYTFSLISYLSNRKIDLDEIWELKDITKNLENLAFDLMPKVHQVIASPPQEYPEPRMWARKEKCWEMVKQINANIKIETAEMRIEFFPKNDATIYLDSEENLYNPVTWSKLLLWNNKYKILNKKQIQLVKYTRSIADLNNNKLTKKQIEEVRDIFIMAVKNGFHY